MKHCLLLFTNLIALSCYCQIVNIPDANFKAYLIGNTAINTNLDTEIQVSEANSFTGAIMCIGLGISDLTGIEAFTSLSSLNCSDNNITALNVSQNLSLGGLTCSNNNITVLDVTQNTTLQGLGCDNNDLQFLDLSQNNILMSLSCGFNQITMLDLSNNPNLEYLYCGYNSLTCLNLKSGGNINLSWMQCLQNPSLSCIEVDDATWSSQNTSWFETVGTVYSENCNNSCTVGLNEMFQPPKQLIRITDLLGRKTVINTNTPLIYYYSDGTIERVFILEE